MGHKLYNEWSARKARMAEFEVIAAILSNLAAILASVASLAYWLGRKFAKIEERFRQMDERYKGMDEKISEIARATASQLEFFTEFPGFRGVIGSSDVAFVKGELRRLAPRANPLTEEARRLRELLDKDELTLEEADELREIARKLVRERGHESEAVWKLLMYASVMRGIALRRMMEAKAQG